MTSRFGRDGAGVFPAGVAARVAAARVRASTQAKHQRVQRQDKVSWANFIRPARVTGL
jgi:hypothetical protein